MQLHPIGVVRSQFRQPSGTPIQPAMANGAPGQVVVHDEFTPGLSDLAGFERIWLVYWFHRAAPPMLKVVPYRDNVERGLFATRAPSRPNPIGISAVRLEQVRGNTLDVLDVDILDGTPLLDIKPYVPRFDCVKPSASGWLESNQEDREKADDRFAGR